MTRTTGRNLAILAIVLGLWVNASAQTAVPDDTSGVVTELEAIQVNLPGPALWRIKKGDAEVIIMGFVRPLPHGLDWQKARIARALDGAHALLVPSEPQLSVLESMGYLLTAGRFQNPQGKTLQQVLPPDDYRIFLSNLATFKGDPKRYNRWKPAIAGVAMIGDLRKAAGLSSEKPVSTVKRLAEQAHIPVRAIGRMRASSLVKVVLQLTDTQSLNCFRREMEQLNYEATQAPIIARAWGKGDVSSLRRFKGRDVVAECLDDLPTIQAMTERGTNEAVSAIDDALSRPGKTVALIDLRYLDRKDGMLDRLKARGAVISVPD